jgi:hypothetical protein
LPWGGGWPEQREKTEVVMKEVASIPSARPSSATERSRRYRQRRRKGTRCITVQVNENGIGALIARGYLPKEARGDSRAIGVAMEVLLSDLELELEQERSKESGPRF